MATKIQPTGRVDFPEEHNKPMNSGDMAVRAAKVKAAFDKDRAMLTVQRKVLSLAPRITAVAEKMAKKASDAAMKATWNNANFGDAVAILKQQMTVNA